MARPLVIGLTGPFGSGCTTTADLLAERHGFAIAKLSAVVRQEWERHNPGKDPLRSDLQALGNQMRKDSSNPGVLAQMAIRALNAKADACVAVDGIRNVGEIEYLRDFFSSGFFLFALECPTSERWKRLAPKYEQIGGLESFSKDDERDRDEEYKFGQQVQLCVDQADLLINNTDSSGHAALRDKLPDYLDLMTGKTPRYATPSEIFMNLAYSAAHGSKCLKRQVGAVLVAAPSGEMGDIVGQGFNENPLPTKPCVEEPQYGANPDKQQRGRCYRDIERESSLISFVKQALKCPICGGTLRQPPTGEPLWKCLQCGQDFEKFFWPERAMTICTAVHAEVAALFAAGRRSRDATLYTTTFPCFQCTEKLVLARIRCIVFNEPYPDVRAVHRLTIAGIETVRFEGIRSRRFDEIFARARRE